MPSPASWPGDDESAEPALGSRWTHDHGSLSTNPNTAAANCSGQSPQRPSRRVPCQPRPSWLRPSSDTWRQRAGCLFLPHRQHPRRRERYLACSWRRYIFEIGAGERLSRRLRSDRQAGGSPPDTNSYEPPLRADVPKIRAYSTVFLISDLGQTLLIIRSFLSRHDLTGTTLVPFITYMRVRPRQQHADHCAACAAYAYARGVGDAGRPGATDAGAGFPLLNDIKLARSIAIVAHSTNAFERHMTQGIADKVVVITGASSGSGEATARYLAQPGAQARSRRPAHRPSSSACRRSLGLAPTRPCRPT